MNVRNSALSMLSVMIGVSKIPQKTNRFFEHCLGRARRMIPERKVFILSFIVPFVQVNESCLDVLMFLLLFSELGWFCVIHDSFEIVILYYFM